MAPHSSTLESPMDGGAWRAAVHGIAKSRTWLSDFTFTFHFHALEKEMATHSSVHAWRIPGTGEPVGLPSTGSQKVRHDWSDLAAAAVAYHLWYFELLSRIDALELWCWRRLLSPLDCKKIKPINPKGNQSWIFIGRTDAKAGAPKLWAPDSLEKTVMLGKIEGRRRRRQ